MSEPFDLQSLDEIKKQAEAGAECKIFHPVTHEPIDGLVIQVVGADSERARTAQRRISNRRLRGLRNRARALDAAQLEDDNIEYLAECTVGWRGVIIEGKAIEHSRLEAVKLYQRFPWIRDQVDAFIAELENFTKG